MRGNLLLVLLLGMGLATGVAQVNKKPGTAHAAGTAKKQKKEAVSRQKEEPQAKTKAAQEEAAEAQARSQTPQEGTAEAQTKKVAEQADGTKVKTEAGQTEDAQAQTAKDPKLTSVPGANALGMSILGNQETPTALVIVPWKSSEVGSATGISPMLDDSRQPVDKDVFMRELTYYEIRSEKKP